MADISNLIGSQPQENANPFASDREWSNLKDKDVSLINTLKAQIISATEGSIAEVDYLKSALQLYKQAIIESIDSNMNAANIIAKYNTNNQGGMSGAYNLPGVFSSAVDTYNIDAMKKDNDTLLAINDTKNQADKQKDTYFKMIVQNYQDLQQRLNVLAQANQQIFAYMSQLNQTFQNG